MTRITVPGRPVPKARPGILEIGRIQKGGVLDE